MLRPTIAPVLVFAGLQAACGGESELGRDVARCTEPDVFVAVDEVGMIARSEGENWRAILYDESPPRLSGLALGGGGSVLAAGRDGVFLRSEDGFAWEPGPTLGGHCEALSSSEDTLVAVGSAFGEPRRSWAALSPDGDSWAELGPALEDVTFASVAHGGGAIVAVGGGALDAELGTRPSALFLFEGDGWLQVTPWSDADPEAPHYHEVLFAADRFVAVGGRQIAWSSDGAQWTVEPIAQHVTGATWDNGLLVATAIEGIGSFDGTTWSWTDLRRAGIPGEITYALEDIAVGHCSTLAVGGPMGWYARLDGSGSWKSAAGPTHFSFKNVVHLR